MPIISLLLISFLLAPGAPKLATPPPNSAYRPSLSSPGSTPGYQQPLQPGRATLQTWSPNKFQVSAPGRQPKWLVSDASDAGLWVDNVGPNPVLYTNDGTGFQAADIESNDARDLILAGGIQALQSLLADVGEATPEMQPARYSVLSAALSARDVRKAITTWEYTRLLVGQGPLALYADKDCTRRLSVLRGVALILSVQAHVLEETFSASGEPSYLLYYPGHGQSFSDPEKKPQASGLFVPDRDSDQRFVGWHCTPAQGADITPPRTETTGHA